MAVRVKICGVTRPEDARTAVNAGASAIGVILWPGSPRCVNVTRAAQIFSEVPPDVMKVGVFVDQPRSFVEQAVRTARIDAIQLHGRENPADYEMGPLVIKSVAVDARFDAGSLRSIPVSVLPLLDAADLRRRGGTGQTVDWGAAAAAATLRPIVLAGGLTPANVRDAIRVVHPYALDVSSGVEVSPGRKSAELVQAFLEAATCEAGAVTRGYWS